MILNIKKISKIRFFDLNQFFSFKSDFIFLIRIFMPSFYQIFETGLSAQSHKQHGRHNSAISSYTLAEQKVSKQQLLVIKVSLPWLYTPCPGKKRVYGLLCITLTNLNIFS